MEIKKEGKNMLSRILAMFLIALMITNMALFGLKRINYMMFWATIAVIGAIAFFVMPKLNR